MQFRPVIPDEGVAVMPPEIFREEWGGLGNYLKYGHTRQFNNR